MHSWQDGAVLINLTILEIYRIEKFNYNDGLYNHLLVRQNDGSSLYNITLLTASQLSH